MIVETGYVSVPIPSEIQNGDAVFLKQADSGETLAAVIDGLGHGPDAAEASRAGVAFLASLPWGITLHDAMPDMHRHMRGTRGAAATVWIIKDFKLEICAVGNVALMCVNCAVPLVLSAGVLGQQVSKFRVAACQIPANSRLALLSDGVSTRFRLEDFRQLDPQAASKEILGRYRRKEDDATVLVADVRR